MNTNTPTKWGKKRKNEKREEKSERKKINFFSFYIIHNLILNIFIIIIKLFIFLIREVNIFKKKRNLLTNLLM
jgi:hypothetical protein